MISIIIKVDLSVSAFTAGSKNILNTKDGENEKDMFILPCCFSELFYP
jgi:hypothetical protein